jgi:DNA invertase Pin-like site-specific DNA recombinase
LTECALRQKSDGCFCLLSGYIGARCPDGQIAQLRGHWAKLEGHGVGLLILSMGGQQLDTRAPTGKLMLTLLAAVAEFERGLMYNLMLERQREGIAKAKAEDAYKGRQPTARAKAADVLRLANEGVTREQIAVRLGIGVASVYRILADV